MKLLLLALFISSSAFATEAVELAPGQTIIEYFSNEPWSCEGGAPSRLEQQYISCFQEGVEFHQGTNSRVLSPGEAFKFEGKYYICLE